MITMERLELILDRLTTELSGFRAEFYEFRTETRSEFEAVRREFRTELRTEIEGLRTELHTEIEGLRTDLRTELRSEVEGLRTDLRTEIGAVRTEMAAGFERVEMKINRVRDDIHQLDKDFDRHMEMHARIEADIDELK